MTKSNTYLFAAALCLIPANVTPVKKKKKKKTGNGLVAGCQLFYLKSTDIFCTVPGEKPPDLPVQNLAPHLCPERGSNYSVILEPDTITLAVSITLRYFFSQFQ